MSRDEAQRLVPSPAAPPFPAWALLAASSAWVGALLTALAWWLSSGLA